MKINELQNKQLKTLLKELKKEIIAGNKTTLINKKIENFVNEIAESEYNKGYNNGYSSGSNNSYRNDDWQYDAGDSRG